jgi:hypothetical protein
MLITSSKPIYKHGNYADEINEIICEVKFESFVIERPPSTDGSPVKLKDNFNISPVML